MVTHVSFPPLRERDEKLPTLEISSIWRIFSLLQDSIFLFTTPKDLLESCSDFHVMRRIISKRRSTVVKNMQSHTKLKDACFIFSIVFSASLSLRSERMQNTWNLVKEAWKTNLEHQEIRLRANYQRERNVCQISVSTLKLIPFFLLDNKIC